MHGGRRIGANRGGLFIARARRGRCVAEEEAQSLQVGPRLFFFSREIQRPEAEAARGGDGGRQTEAEVAGDRDGGPKTEAAGGAAESQTEAEAAGGTRGTGICEWIDSTRARGE